MVLSAFGWSPIGMDPFVEDSSDLWQQPWRLFTAHFLHADVFHLVFNLYWTWLFGRLLEPRLGALRFAALAAFVMLGVSLGCIAFDRGGIGLSGLGYGLWAFLLAGARRSPMLRGLLDRRTHLLFIGWFCVCIVLTLTNIWSISNWGHGLGAALGACAAPGVGADLRWSWRASLTPIAVLLALGACATALRERVNFGGGAGIDAYEGYLALQRDDFVTARARFSSAVRISPDDGDAWWNLACAHHALGENEPAAEAAFRAFELGSLEPRRLDWLVDALVRRTTEQVDATDFDRALEHAMRAARVVPDRSEVWVNVRVVARHAGDEPAACRAEAELVRLGK
jgi:GlpG protein